MGLKDIFRTKSAATTSGPLAPRVKEQLEDAERRLSSLEARRGDLALNVATGGDGADDEMERYRREVEAARHEVSRPPGCLHRCRGARQCRCC